MIYDIQQKNLAAYIKYDMVAIFNLLKDYQSTEQFILDELPDVNWNSKLETKEFFDTHLGIDLESDKISVLQELLAWESCDDNYEREIITGLIELKKVQSVIRNYLKNIVKHVSERGYYPLRLVDGEWLQMNKRGLPYDPNIKECIIEMHIPEAVTGAKKEI